MALNSKHPYTPEWSWGNVISAIAVVVPILAGGISVYILMRVDSAVAEEKIVTLDKKVDEAQKSSNVRIDKIEIKLADLGAAAEEMRVTQAIMRANIEMLMRAQGLRPIDESTVAPRRHRD